jgi:hypothetical protein
MKIDPCVVFARISGEKLPSVIVMDGTDSAVISWTEIVSRVPTKVVVGVKLRLPVPVAVMMYRHVPLIGVAVAGTPPMLAVTVPALTALVVKVTA